MNENPIIKCAACCEDSSPKVQFNEEVTLCESCIKAGYDFLLASGSEDSLESPVESIKPNTIEAIQQEVACLIKPTELCARLDEYVIGQEHAKRMISVAIYNHQKRIILEKHGLKDQAQRSNLLLIGPTGTGKTLIAETIAKLCNLPIHIQDCTPLTEAGYIGESVEEMLAELLVKCDGDVKRAETQGIIFLDEIDKLRKRGDSANLNRDPSGDGVQSALLKLCEGADVRVPNSNLGKRGTSTTLSMNTSQILFIGSGAFEGIEQFINDSSSKAGMGFLGHVNSDAKSNGSKSFAHKIKSEHIVKYGMKAEFVGRFSTVVGLDDLSLEQMKSIIRDSKKSILGSHQMLAKADGIDLTITDEAIELIAEDAFAQKIGARGLEGTINRILEDFSFNSPSQGITEFEISADMIHSVLN